MPTCETFQVDEVILLLGILRAVVDRVVDGKQILESHCPRLRPRPVTSFNSSLDGTLRTPDLV